MYVSPDVFFISLGVLALAYGFWQLHRELAPRLWIRVQGIILTSRVEKKLVDTGGVAMQCEFLPLIEYEYQYDGQLFKSSMRRAGNYSSGQLPPAEAIVARYPVGSEIRVFVNAKRPEMAVLEYGTTPLSWISIALGLIVTSLGLFVLMGR